MYIIQLSDTEYLMTVGRTRQWEPITPAEDNVYMHLYDSGYKAVKSKELATHFTNLEQVNLILSNTAIQELFPNAKIEQF